MSTRSPIPPASTVVGEHRPRRRRWLITLGVIVALVAAGIGVVFGILLPQQQKCSTAADPSRHGAVIEYCAAEPVTAGGAMARGSDGNLWYTNGGQKITRFTVKTSAVTEFAAPTAPNQVAFQGMVNGSDGNLWYIANYTLGRMSMNGEFKEFALPRDFGFSGSIAAGADGTLWVTMGKDGRYQLLKITPPIDATASPVITNVALPSNALEAIAAAPDGGLWVATAVASGETITATHILRITPDGAISQLPQTLTGAISALTAGPENTMWFYDTLGHIGRMTLVGAPALFPVSAISRDMPPMSLALGPDGAMWFPTQANGVNTGMGRITPSGVITTFTLPHTGGMVSNITAGPDGGVWFLLGFSQPWEPSPRIVRITP